VYREISYTVMETVTRQSILIIEPNTSFREELYNFLLSAGYQHIEETDGFASAAIERIARSSYGAILVDAGVPLAAGLQFATDLAKLSPNTRIVLMIDPEDQPAWDRIAAPPVEVQFLIKTDIARNLLYLLEVPLHNQ
jgi:DNA-binding NarL/FixJ family response regulator